MQSNATLLLNSREAAAVLSISQRKLWSMTKSGQIPCVKIGHSTRYPTEELKGWIAAQMQGGGDR
jgi:excisionase family DNA binding protein